MPVVFILTSQVNKRLLSVGKVDISLHSWKKQYHLALQLSKKCHVFWQLAWSMTEAVNDINKMSWDQKCVGLSQLIEVIQTTLGLESSEVLLVKIK